MRNILIILFLCLGLNAQAQKGFRYLSIAGGNNVFETEENYSFDVELESVKDNYHVLSFGVNGYKQKDKEEYLGFIAWKPPMSKSKNFMTKWNLNFDMGHNRKDLIFGFGAGVEFQYHFKNHLILFAEHQYKALFFADDFWRNQTSVGIKISL
ncbi:MAG: hypothetical protein ACPGSD_12060 [Flavobacteriales bacterium]|jgi:hypothetical protein